MVSTPKRQGFYAWDEQDARSIASNTPTYGGALFKTYAIAEALPPAPRPRVTPRCGKPRLRFSTRLKVLARLRPRLVRLGG